MLLQRDIAKRLQERDACSSTLHNESSLMIVVALQALTACKAAGLKMAPDAPAHVYVCALSVQKCVTPSACRGQAPTGVCHVLKAASTNKHNSMQGKRSQDRDKFRSWD